MNVLKKLRIERGYNQQKLAELLNVSRSTIAMWETKKAEPNSDILIKLSNIFHVSVDYLLGNEPTNAEPFSYETTGTLKIPVYGYIPAGVPMEAIEDILDYEEAPEDWSIGGREFFGLKIKGDSMEPEYRNGDVIIFLKQNDCENNEDCAVAVNGDDWTFKRVEKTAKGILIKPLNPNYETKFFTNKECAEIPVQVKGVFWELRRSKRK